MWDAEALLHPLGRNGSIEEIAAAIGFLACDHAGFITGESFYVDGGRQLI
jgi:NAD(P)-dependent dehydrogenase (short-subunit alcohol dehydrogenase family)